MRILCLTARLPYPPNRGDRLRAYNFLKSLSRQHELHLLSFIEDASEHEHIAPLQQFCQTVQVVQKTPRQSAVSVGLNLWRPQPLQSLYYRSAAMQQLVDATLRAQPFDAAYIHLFRMAQFIEKQARLYRIIDLTDVISREIALSMPYRGLASRLLYTIERPRIQRCERWVAERFEETWLISEADRRTLAEACPAANIQVVTNGIDVERFHPTGQTAEPNTIIFSGHMGVPHNIDAATLLAREVLPLVQQTIPACRLRIVGAGPGPEVLRLAQAPAVTVTGFVPDLNAELNQAAVFTAPLRFAAGVQNKVLEAMAAATPVVTTRLVNEGIGAQPGKHLLIAEGIPETAQVLISLLNNPPARQEIGQAGSEFVRQKFSWDIVLTRVNEIAQINTTAGGPL